VAKKKVKLKGVDYFGGTLSTPFVKSSRAENGHLTFEGDQVMFSWHQSGIGARIPLLHAKFSWWFEQGDSKCDALLINRVANRHVGTFSIPIAQMQLLLPQLSELNVVLAPSPPAAAIPGLDHSPQSLTPEALSELLATSNKLCGSIIESVRSLEGQMKASNERFLEGCRGRKLRSLGVATQVVLFENEVHLPGNVIPITPEVRATASSQGNKQEVQGWVFKSATDRREFCLSVSWPGGQKDVFWENNPGLFGTDINPQQIRGLAEAINKAADDTPQRLLELRRITTPNVVDQVAFIEDRSRELSGLIDLGVEIRSSLMNVLGTSYGREAKTTQTELHRMSSAITKAKSTIVVGVQTIGQLQAWLRLPGEATATMGVGAAINPAPLATEAAIEAIERLAILKDAGVLTQEEFDSKKAELLRRI
jgi:hypothetical protein